MSGKISAAVITAESLLRIFPPAGAFKSAVISLHKGGDYNLSELTGKLVSCGYKRENAVEGRGLFALRGDILDIYTVNDKPVRIDFFDTVAEEIKYFDTESGKSYARAQSVK